MARYDTASPSIRHEQTDPPAVSIHPPGCFLTNAASATIVAPTTNRIASCFDSTMIVIPRLRTLLGTHDTRLHIICGSIGARVSFNNWCTSAHACLQWQIVSTASNFTSVQKRQRLWSQSRTSAMSSLLTRCFGGCRGASISAKVEVQSIKITLIYYCRGCSSLHIWSCCAVGLLSISLLLLNPLSYITIPLLSFCFFENTEISLINFVNVIQFIQ